MKSVEEQKSAHLPSELGTGDASRTARRIAAAKPFQAVVESTTAEQCLTAQFGGQSSAVVTLSQNGSLGGASALADGATFEVWENQ
jgi:hypothetical protein